MLLKWNNEHYIHRVTWFYNAEWSSKTKSKCKVSRAQFWCPHPPFSAHFPSSFPVLLLLLDPWWISLLSTLLFLHSRPIFQKVAVNFHFISPQADGTFVNFPQWHWLLFPLLHSAQSWPVDSRSEPGRNCRCFQEIWAQACVCSLYTHELTHTHFQVTYTQLVYFWLNYIYKSNCIRLFSMGFCFCFQCVKRKPPKKSTKF